MIMHIMIDVKSGYTDQFMTILQSLDKNFFNEIRIDESSEFAKNKKYLEQELSDLDSGFASTFNEEDFWDRINNTIEKF